MARTPTQTPPPEDRPAVSARIDRTDLTFQMLALTFFLGVAITAWVRS